MSGADSPPHFRAVLEAKKLAQFQLPTMPPRANRALIPPGIGRTGLSFIHSKAVASAVRGGGVKMSRYWPY